MGRSKGLSHTHWTESEGLSNLCLILDDLKKHGVGLAVTRQSIDTSTNDAAANLQLNVLSAVCHFEREMIIHRVQAGGMGIWAIARELDLPLSSVHSVVHSAKKRASKRRPRSQG